MATIKIELKDGTVSDMRRNLARALSKIDGALKIDNCTFSLTVLMPKRQIPNFPKGD
jgi:hypothetical protein